MDWTTIYSTYNNGIHFYWHRKSIDWASLWLQIFNEIFLEIFWTHLCTGNYAQLTIKVVFILLIFPTTNLCERGVSTKSNFKTLKINRLQTEHGLRIALCKIEPRWSLLCENSQNQILLWFFIFVSLYVIKIKYYLKKCKFSYIQL